MSETTIKSDGKFQVLVEGERYRVCTISRLGNLGRDENNNTEIKIINLPISYGLAIEQKLKNGHYYVVAFVKWDYEAEEATFEPVGFRPVETLDGIPQRLVDEYYNTVMFARNAIEDVTSVDVLSDSDEEAAAFKKGQA